MSSDDSQGEDKKLTGFQLNPEGRNTNGRPKGSKNKIPSDKDFHDALKRSSNEAIEKMVSIMRKGTENNQLKAAVKLVDARYQIERDVVRDKIEIQKIEHNSPKVGLEKKDKTDVLAPVLVLDMPSKA